MLTLFIYLSVYQPYDQKLMQYTVNYVLKQTLNRVKPEKKNKKTKKRELMLIQYKIKKNSNIVHHRYHRYFV